MKQRIRLDLEIATEILIESIRGKKVEITIDPFKEEFRVDHIVTVNNKREEVIPWTLMRE